MAFCPVCGEQVPDNAPNCPKCGASLGDKNNTQSNTQQAVNDFVNNLNNTADYSSQMDANDVEQNKVMAILAYIWILVFVTIFAAPQSKFARFHANQGLTLFIFEVIYGVIMTALGVTVGKIPVVGPITLSICGLVGLVWLILSICGIVNAVNGKAKELPVLGNIHLMK
ncbi:MAG: zinc-ribbon domain-containing protein [Ruminococcus sp.]|nr:zinc-ribbon domain-containing protein [Ruminococcus sp.]